MFSYIQTQYTKKTSRFTCCGVQMNYLGNKKKYIKKIIFLFYNS